MIVVVAADVFELLGNHARGNVNLDTHALINDVNRIRCHFEMNLNSTLGKLVYVLLILL